MSRIEQVFAGKSHKALIAYVTVGYPSLAATLEIVPLLASSGCDIVELGIPFSDPLADGLTIQRASYEALRQGISPEICLEVARRLRHQVSIPLIFMGYYNPVLHYGLEPFCNGCARGGIDGLIIPDLPPEEGVELEGLAQSQGVDLIYLLAPTSSDRRIELVAERTRGFIYLVSVTGTTGARGSLPQDLESFVAKVRARTRRPLCVGFGISTPEQARRLAGVADGIVVGSRIIELIEEDASLEKLRAFVGRLREEID
jgi:tryptophan synthase alpha chain